ncbi:MAG: hypothetical protein ACPIG6_06385 [Akkermansiaceae bacterium]
MIQPDAKCVVNGHKVNEVIDALNPLLNMDIIVGNVAQPQIQYSSGAIQIVIPPGGGASTNEQLDIVDENNQASTRWFLTTTTQGSGGAAIASDTGTNIGSAGGKNNPAATSGDRDKLGGGTAGGPAGGKNRDNLDRAAAGGGAAPIGGNDGQGGVVGGGVIIDNPQGAPLADPTTGRAIAGTGTNRTGGGESPQGMPKYDPTTGTSTPPTGPDYFTGDEATVGGPATDEFGNWLDGSGDGMPKGALKDTRDLDGDFPPPKPGAPPLGGDDTISSQPPIPRSKTASKSKAKQSDIEENKRKQKALDKERWERSTEKWLMDQDAARRQSEADRMAAMNRSGAKYSPYARGRG